MLTSSSFTFDKKTLAAFLLVILLGGSNSVAIRFSNQELAPFWGAFVRFFFAGSIFWLIFWVRRMSLPRRSDVAVIALNGFLSTGVSFALLYWALQKMPVSLATVVISTSPLFTLILAVLHRLEKFRVQALFGGVIAIAGLALVVNAQPGGRELLPGMIGLLVSALVAAEGNVIFKMYSLKSDPVIINAISMTSGSIFLGAASWLAHEAHVMPSTPQVWGAVTYLILGGSVVMFYMFVYVLSRWKASSASYAILFFPLIATLLAAWLANEAVSMPFILGAALVLTGVWVGAFYGDSGA
ncbi:MAG: EamA family transporter [Anaerolineales bacterium]|nr:EamA family transporter [Anaerolineales bacterium]MCB9145910.1 EamA family transporter [Anaerolineales bacterium]